MPKADPAQWKEARSQWEGTDMTYSEVAKQLGVAVPTVTLRAKREMWVKSDVIDVQRINYTPRQLAEIAVRTLVRACNQTRDPAAAVKAAGMLLDRTMGRVAAVQEAPMLPPEMPEGTPKPNEWPDWLESRRLAYQEGPPEGDAPALEAATPAATPSPPRLERPVIAGDRPVPLLHAVPPPAPPHPAFWDGPSRPASGSHREPV